MDILSEVVAELVSAWPTTAWSAERIAIHLDRQGDPAAWLERERADLLLAWACLEGDRAALALFEQTCLRDATWNLRALGIDDAAVDEILQRCREKLLVGVGAAPPALTQYRGRGPLGAFVRTIAVRLAYDQRRNERERPADIAVLATGASADPELEYMRTLYAQQLVDALRSAWQRLQAHDRFILGLQVFDGVSLEDLSRIYQIHRASAARRCASARAALIAETRDQLRSQLSVGDDTLDSILRVVTTSVQMPPLEIPRP